MQDPPCPSAIALATTRVSGGQRLSDFDDGGVMLAALYSAIRRLFTGSISASNERLPLDTQQFRQFIDCPCCFLFHRSSPTPAVCSPEILT